eukprot:gene9308-11409_t
MESPKINKIKSVCVFCGSRPGNDPVFLEYAKKLGLELSKRGYDLVYGGGNVGLMGEISQTMFDNGSKVKGIIPKSLSPKEISGTTVGELLLVEDMHERKRLMYSEADAFVVLPGGIGTFEELLECLTWIHLGIHSKPIGILNVNGYYSGLLELFTQSSKSGFTDSDFMNSIVISSEPSDLVDELETRPPPKNFIQWLKPSEI